MDKKFKDSLLLWAEHYSQYKLHLIPLPERNKATNMKEWQKRASSDLATVTNWVVKGYPQDIEGKNILELGGLGIATGQISGIIVLDIDGEDGKLSYKKLLEKYGDIDPTPTQRTPGGGLHLFFKSWGPCKSSTKILYKEGFKGLDVRADGGYVVAAPSIHPNGGAYIWEMGKNIKDIPLLDPPLWLKDIIEGNITNKMPSTNIGSILEGSRNSKLTSIAGTLRNRGLSQTEIEKELLEINSICCIPPLEEKEVRSIAKSIGNKPFLDHNIIAQSQSEFAEFIPLEQNTTLPLFPLDILPPITRDFVSNAVETVQAPADIIAPCVLGVLEVACRGRYPVRLPQGHVERACLYIAPIAAPSERKSGAIKIITKPLVDYENKYNLEHNGEVNQNNTEYRLLLGRIEKIEQLAIKENEEEKRQDLKHMLQNLNNELANFVKIEQLRLFSSDITSEKLAAMLKSQGEVFALISAEGGEIFDNVGRYSEKGGLDIYLGGYSGDAIRVDRKNSDSIVINSPTINLITPCQPVVITKLFADSDKIGRGLLSRIMYVKCRSLVGTRKAIVKEIDKQVEDKYTKLCCEMLADTTKGDLSFDNSGFAAYNSFHDEIEPQLKPNIGEMALMGDFMCEWGGKLVGNMCRISGLIHCISAYEQHKNPLDTKINVDEACAASEIARFFLEHAKAVYTEQIEPEDISNAKYLWNKINSFQAMQISKRDLIRKVSGKTNINIDESLKTLIGRGYIKVDIQKTGGVGRPSETIIVNPETQKNIDYID